MSLAQIRRWIADTNAPLVADLDAALAEYAAQVRQSERATVTVDLREQIAQDIQRSAHSMDASSAWELDFIDGMLHAAELVRGGDQR